MVDDLKFLRVVADIGSLPDLLSRLRDGYLYFYGVVEQCDGQLADLRRHGGREHDALTVLGELLHDLHDVFDEAHIEHTVRLVKYEEGTTGQVQIAHLQMTEQSARSGDEYVSTQPHST